MSSTSDLTVKKDRGTSLTIEQYEIFLHFLKQGIRPNRKSLKNAGLVGTLNGGQGTGKPKTFARFKSIVKRLEYRESDDELVFKANSKIVIPNNRFEEVILQAHKSHGRKHLNLTKTIQKLGEKYTFGCRQFGISEENVRVVIKSCDEGSCADKHKGEMMGVFKHFANPGTASTSKTCTCSLKESDSSQTKQNDQNPASVIKFPVINTIPMTVVRLPNGTFGIQPASSTCISGFPPFKQVPLLNAKTLPSSQVALQQHTHTFGNSASNATMTNMLNVLRVPPYMPYTSTESKDFNCAPIPVQLVKIGSQPMMGGQQICFINGNAGFANLFNTAQNFPQPIDLSKSSKPLDLTVGASVSQPEPMVSEAPHDNMEDSAVPLDINGNPSTAQLQLDQNNNDISPNEMDWDMGNKTEGKALQNGSSTAIDNSSLDPCCHGNREEVLDLTLSPLKSEILSEGTDHLEGAKSSFDFTGQSRRDSCKLPPLPNPKIWYYRNDLSKQTNPYERISMCIKDMRLDFMRSLTGSLQATEMMKKKMHYIQEMIAAQKNVTQYFADLK